ncbi:AI-2E family transporter [Catalinimonas niigatensis]|uniref:AI-2E family transporter n=1 Tax=Catalinimonas niigatensis TaxID=1397264 RepID=UPI002AA29CEE|nr:AI-2E family transporter [Catalinimonas niigatensis]WPP49457.1 AI-2E family transporter [Catalinimonas niigatensis]
MINKSVLYIILFALSFVMLAWIFSDIFGYFVIALILSAIFSPLTNYINRLHFYGYHMPRFVAVLISFAVIIFLISSFVILFIPLIDDQVQIITEINYEDLYYRASAPLQRIETFLFNSGIIEDEDLLVESLRTSLLSFIGAINFGEFFNQLISFTGTFFIGILAVVFITFVLLYEKGIVRRQAIKLIPNHYFEVFIAAIYKIETLLSNYLIGLLLQVFSIFCIASLGLSLFGINYALTIAVFAAVANLIPYAGPILGAAFGIAVGLSTTLLDANTNEVIILAVKVISVFSVVQLTDNLVLQPLIFSKSVKAHPLEIFIVIFAGATIAGVIGMIAAIPVYTILKVVYMELYTGYKQYHIFKTK